MTAGPSEHGPQAGTAAALGRLIVRFRHAIVAFWAVAAVVVTMVLPTIEEAQVGALGDLVPNDADAIDAELRSATLFGFPLLSRTLVVQRDPAGLDALEQARVLQRASAVSGGDVPRLERVGGALPVLNTLGRPPFSRERSTTAVTYLFFPPSVGQDDRLVLAERFEQRLIRPAYGGYAGVTGALAARAAQAREIEDALPVVELATLVLVLLVVGIHFRAVGAPLANLAAVAVAYLVSIRVIAWVGERVGVSVPREVEPVIVVLLFGVITDYSIFLLSRVRRRLEDGERPADATAHALGELLPIITTAALTVVAASAALVVAKLGFFQAFGPGMAMAVLLGALVAMTLVPALVALAGPAAFWPSAPGSARAARAGDDGEPRAGRSRAITVATTRPLATTLACTALLLAAAAGMLRLDLGNPIIRGLPEDAPARVAYGQAAQGFAPGVLAPAVVVVEGPGITRERAALRRLQRLLARERGVAQVVGPSDQPLRERFGAVFSRSASAARLFVVLDSDPLGARAIEDMRALQRRIGLLLERSGLPLARASFAGDTALSAETIDDAVDDAARVVPVALLLVLATLAVFLRALVAPLYLVAASVLALLAALGLTTWVFQDLLGYGEISYFVPFAAAVLLLSLGSDYNVFLAGRIWAESRRRPLTEAVRHAGSRAATPITIAGLVLAGSFALLALVPVRPFRELAFAMAVGLVLDAFLVRTLLVPALIALVGERSAWPGRGLGGAARDEGPGGAPS